MLLIRCPWCGDRAQVEFSYVGDASRVRPPDLQSLGLEDWHAFVYLRGNPRGTHTEHWHHAAGCRRLVRVVRDTATHEIVETSFESPRESAG